MYRRIVTDGMICTGVCDAAKKPRGWASQLTSHSADYTYGGIRQGRDGRELLVLPLATHVPSGRLTPEANILPRP